jgi:formate dehydrogenase subunit beta
MRETAQNIVAIAKRLLDECKVEMVIGFRKGSLPMMNEPCVARTPAEAEALVWDSHCGVNLANYLTGRKEKIAVVAKGCDSRNIANHIIENKVVPDNLTIIGVPCSGMVDRRKVAARFEGEIREVAEDGETLTVTGDGFDGILNRSEVLQDNCRVCTHRNPVIYDELAGEAVPEQTGVDRYEDVRTIEALEPDARQKFFDDLFAPCIRCYACRNACPLCYCPTCFVDESRPQWVGKSQDEVDIKTFHFLRAYHCAGRCTDCGACQRACPVGINMRLLTKKLEMDCFEQYGWEAGLDTETRPALEAFTVDDPNEGIL